MSNVVTTQKIGVTVSIPDLDPISTRDMVSPLSDGLKIGDEGVDVEDANDNFTVVWRR